MREGSATTSGLGSVIKGGCSLLITYHALRITHYVLRSPDPRIEDPIEQVHRQVDRDEDRGEQQCRGLDHGIVALLDRLDRARPDPRHRKDRLDDEGAAE